MRHPLFSFLLIPISIVACVYAAYALKAFAVAEPDSPRIAVVLKSLNVRSDFWQTVSAGAQVAARQYGAELELDGPLREADADAQIAALEEAVARRPQAIVVSPYDHDRMPEMIRRIQNAGIRLVIIDTPLEVEPAPVFVGNDHREAGRLAAARAAELTDGKPVAAILTDGKAVPVSKQRLAGVNDVLAAYPGSLYGTYRSGDTEAGAYDSALTLLRGEPEFNVFLTLGAEATQGAARAIREAAAGDRVRLVGFDSTIEEIQLLEAGVLDATVVQKPFNMGYLGVKTALDMLAGGPERDVDIASTLVTRDNMYAPEIQKLLFPFIDNP